MRVSTTIQVTLEIEVSGNIISADTSVGDMLDFAEDIEISFDKHIISCDTVDAISNLIIEKYEEEIQEALCEPSLREKEPEKDD